MHDGGNVLLVITTCPDTTSGKKIAAQLVADGLAACVTLVGGAESVFRWQGKLEYTNETLLLIKTTAARYDELTVSLRALHPYELPEILAVGVDGGLAGYLQWIQETTTR